jgi:hypothetical protein
MVGQQAAAIGFSLLAALVPAWERPVMGFVEVRDDTSAAMGRVSSSQTTAGCGTVLQIGGFFLEFE